jgi:AhpC/TSA family
LSTAQQPLAVGGAVPALEAPRWGGGRIHAKFNERPTIIYVFSPRCVWCERNLDNARSLVRHTKAGWDFIGVTLDKTGLDAYLNERHLEGWRVAVDVDQATQRAFHFGNTPQTIVVAPGGRVTNVWTGAFVGDVAKEVEATFGLALPGLAVSN